MVPESMPPPVSGSVPPPPPPLPPDPEPVRRIADAVAADRREPRSGSVGASRRRWTAPAGSGRAAAPPHAARVRTSAGEEDAQALGSVSMAARRRGSRPSGSGVGVRRVDPRRDARASQASIAGGLAEQVAELVGALEEHQLRERIDVERQVLVAGQVDDLRLEVDRQLDVRVALRPARTAASAARGRR